MFYIKIIQIMQEVEGAESMNITGFIMGGGNRKIPLL